ncbi:MAG: glycosyltransferase [Acetobacteraceae bacterium]
MDMAMGTRALVDAEIDASLATSPIPAALERAEPDVAAPPVARHPQPGALRHLLDPARPVVPPRIAIVHEWLENYGGAERVLEQLLTCFPQADLFAIVDFLPRSERQFLQSRPVHTSFIQRLPLSRRLFRNYLGLMPIAVQQFDMSGYDVVISSNHAVAKGVITGPDQVHISYTHSPMRYAWDLQHQYLRQADLEKGLRGAYARWQLARLRQWDVLASVGVDHFVANSQYIARRIHKVYRRDAVVIHPPVDVERFRPLRDKDEFFLLACRFVPYKRADLVVETFARDRRRRLVVVGDGPDRARIHKLAQGAANIELRGIVPQVELIDLMQRARALVFAGEEDFGISMVEAQACGTPVIAFGRGGARDIVAAPESDNPTGLFFERQEPGAVALALAEFESLESRITSRACRANALRFSPARFRAEVQSVVDGALRAGSMPPAPCQV